MAATEYNTPIYTEQGGARQVIGVGGELLIQGVVTGLSHGSNFFVDSVSGSDTNDGLSWATAKATIDAATNLCTANKGDRVWIAPLHNEGFGDAQLDLDVAGVAYIGIGEGSARPRIDFDHANASINVKANGIRIENITLLPSVTDVLIGIDVEAAVTDTKIISVESLPGEDGAGVDEFAKTVDIKAGCTRTLIDGCRFTQHASAAGVLSCVCLTGASDLVTIRNCDDVDGRAPASWHRSTASRRSARDCSSRTARSSPTTSRASNCSPAPRA
jgi:hypothetical protein